MLRETFLAFCEKMREDPRIAPRHISLYMSLLHAWEKSAFAIPFEIVRQDIMEGAKISARFTYNKCMNELQEYGYIIYMPTSDPRMRAKVRFVK